jgi:GTP-binding protein
VNISAEFVTSAADAGGVPRDGLSHVALAGRSNVGKSSLINALLRQRLARTSAAPGKTRLVNVYRVRRGSHPPFDLVDLPGYGYARGGPAARGGFDRLVGDYFAALPASALLLVDARHPGLASDRQAWAWLTSIVDEAAIVATKIDKLARGERVRALRELESVFGNAVLPVSAVTGEGLDDLWNLIDRLTNPRTRPTSRPPSSRPSAPGATAPRGRTGAGNRKKSSGSTSRRSRT